MPVIYQVSAGRSLVITDDAIAALRSYAQRRMSQPESGGVLLGRHLLDSDDQVIDEITAPQRADRKYRYSFFRSATHNQLADRRWKQSGGTVAYLGLWHSHPEEVPTPSQTDLRDWKHALAHDRYAGDSLFFVIVGTRELGCWHGQRNGNISILKERHE